VLDTFTEAGGSVEIVAGVTTVTLDSRRRRLSRHLTRIAASGTFCQPRKNRMKTSEAYTVRNM